MPILLILFITSSCLPLPWPDRPFGLTAGQSATLTFVTMAIPILVSMRLSRWVVRTLRRDPDQRPRVVARYAKVRRTMILVNLGAAILCVLGWGWGATVWESFTTTRPFGQVVLFPGAELLVPLPYFLTIFLNWLIYHGAERALHQSSYAVRDGRKSPVFWSVFDQAGSISHRIETAAGTNSWARIEFANGNGQWDVGTSRGFNGDQLYFFREGATSTALAIQPNGDTRVSGNMSVASLTIRGGADLAEPFAMSQRDVPSGAVVVIDPANPGRLKMSHRGYDKRVAGIVSGAKGIHPGISMIQEDTLEPGENVALSGRVYVKANTNAGPIEPGDLLTTSDIPGEAMKAADPARAQGAVLGKAMTGLSQGDGTVLVLVTLQ